MTPHDDGFRERPLAEVAGVYMDHLLAGRRREAEILILGEAEAGRRVGDLYLEVFQPVLHEIGTLWQAGLVSVAQEHYCTAATQFIMSRLYPYIFRAPVQDRVMVGACVSGELHEVGIRMVTDFFEMAGWDTHYLGASMPESDLVAKVKSSRADVLALSVTMGFHLPRAARIIKAVRADTDLAGIRILAGGYALLVAPGLRAGLGMDGFGANAAEAVRLASQWFPSGEA
jgi:methanogenic corrinoid protein MtbC1